MNRSAGNFEDPSSRLFNTSTNHPIIPNANDYIIYKKYVSIHSEDRDILKYPNSNQFEIEMPEGVDSTIKLSDSISMIMKYPSASITDKITQFDNEVDLMTFFIINCIDTIVTEEEIYPASEYSDEELEEFLDQLPVNSFEKIRTFFEQMPKLYHKIEYKNELGSDRSIELTNLKDFFMWR